MSVGFIVCPECQNLLLPDTAQCPKCQHVLDESRVQEAPMVPQQELASEGEQEAECGSCGEMVRLGLVRCWNCGNFMRDDIAQTYEKMRATPQPVIYSPLPETDTSPPAAEASNPEVAPASQDTFSADDGDFELGDEDDFEMDGAFAAEPAAAESDTIPLAKPEPTPEPTPEPAAESDSGTIPLATSPADSDAGDDEFEEIAPIEDDDTDDSKSESSSAPAATESKDSAEDDLLNVAMAEEVEAKKRRAKRRRASGGIIVFCPNGHRVEVQQRHRGKTGKCPKCKLPFVVPAAAPDAEGEKKEEVEVGPKPSEVGEWMVECQLHNVDPTKLKLKPGSLQTGAQQVDVWLRDEKVSICQLTKAGLFGSGNDPKARTAAREKLREQLDAEIPLSDAGLAEIWDVSWDDLKEGLKVVQPALYAHESMFAGIPVFGEYRIGLRLPMQADGGTQTFLSMELTNFRLLSARMVKQCGTSEFGAETGIPLADSFSNCACHYNETLMKPLEEAEYYKVDPLADIELIGWRCEGCGLVVSEDARKKEKIGGASGKGIAKAKCPKCSQKFGNHPLHALPAKPAGDTDEAETEADES